MARFKDANWNLRTVPGQPNTAATDNDVTQALLMDIRDELKVLNAVFRCPNFQAIPRVLKDIRARTGRIPTIRRASRKRSKA